MELYEIVCYAKEFIKTSSFLFLTKHLNTEQLNYINSIGKGVSSEIGFDSGFGSITGGLIKLASEEAPKAFKVASSGGGVVSSFTNFTIFALMIIVLFYVLFNIMKSNNGESSSMLGDLDVESNSGVVSGKRSTTASNTKFADVAGLIEAKEEVKVFVDIMKNRDKYLKMGAKLPKGFLMVGPPGCGKTLLAKAIAGEAGVNFIAANGSEFDEMYVGVGASRVRNLFKKARENAPCIVFIDEIDGIGGKRGQVDNREHDKTLNNLLTEMDGFHDRDQILCIGATNRLETLDEALRRSGRFDKHIVVDTPSLEARREIFSLYLKKLKLDINKDSGADPQTIDTLSRELAKITPGVSGADIENICNQAAIIAVNEKSEVVTLDHLKRAVEDVCIGGQRRSRKVNESEKKVVAYHESGHAVLGYILKNTGAPQIISCIPRGAGNLGYTMPHHEDEMLKSRQKMIEDISALLGGTIAEEVFFSGEITTGASNDIERATALAYAMCTQYGMSKQIGKIQMSIERENRVSGGPKVSQETMSEVDKVVKKLVSDIYTVSKEIMIKNSKLVEILANYLLEKEEIRKDKIEELLGPAPYKSITLSAIDF
ncbi:CYFA0S28e00188g1_1 [Yasminevirus sp. GU-2018]|uniref:CYFA0S28e00188g1_1 n=1 Tax=Yasminevirus sp. GU-2018 TaxID=2420051 RepID=A0A5K0U878_9VIRU|nr:CYFA0S28e00188g1_1 [Yasminevirus sp. GU-2018]